MASSSIANSDTASALSSGPLAVAGDSASSYIGESLHAPPQRTTQSPFPSLTMDGASYKPPICSESVPAPSPNSSTTGLSSTMSSTATSSLSSQVTVSLQTSPIVYSSSCQIEGSDLKPPASSSSSVSCSHAQLSFKPPVPDYQSSDHVLNNNSSTHLQMSRLVFAPTLDLLSHQSISTTLPPLPRIPTHHAEPVVPPSLYPTAVPNSFALGANYPNILPQDSEPFPAPSSVDTLNAAVPSYVMQPVTADFNCLEDFTWTLADSSFASIPGASLLARALCPPAQGSTGSLDTSFEPDDLSLPPRIPSFDSPGGPLLVPTFDLLPVTPDESRPLSPTFDPSPLLTHGNLSLFPDDNTRSVEKLASHSMNDTGIYSPSRYPLPRCYPGTRKSVVEEVISWMADERREHNLLWLYGPAGAGKTALAQTIAEYADKRYMLDAAVFLSRDRNRNDPSRLWTTVSHQLVQHNYQGELFIEEQIREDETVLTADSRTQFDRLVVKLLLNITGGSPMMKERLHVVEEGPLDMERELFDTERGLSKLMEKLFEMKGGGVRLIVIDGLDECQGEEEQCKIIEGICDALRYPLHLPALWMICSRPEPHLKHIFQQAESEGLCWIKELRVDDPEAQSDVERYLQDELWRIAKRHGGDLCEKGAWPPKDAFDKIVTASSGLFVFAVTVGRFTDEPGSDPRSQLAAVINSIDGSPTSSSAVNPFAYLDKLYIDILERSRSDVLPMMLHLLGICAVCPALPMLHLTQLLEFDLDTFRTALVSLHSIVDVPSGEDTIEQPLRYYHASFPDFLTNPDRSGRYSQDPDPHRVRIAEACLRVLGNAKASYAESLAWDPSDFGQANPSNLSVSHVILTFAATHVWDVCTKIGSSKLESIPDTLARFDYRYLRSVSGVIPVKSFIRFLRWLYSLTKHLQSLSHLVRITPRSLLDAQLIGRCDRISRPLALEPMFDEGDLEECPRYALVGFKEKSVIVLLVPDGVIIYSMEDIDNL